MSKRQGIKKITTNRKAFFNYEIEAKLEAGIVLEGTEVKSIRAGYVSLDQAYAAVENGELWLYNCHVKEYPWGNRQNHDPTRKRKLLLHKRQLAKWSEAVQQSGSTIVPISMYLKNGRIKVQLGLGKGKKLHDKRQTLKRRTAQREIDRHLSR